MIRVAVAGAHGKMGTLARNAVERAGDCTYAGGFDRVADANAHVYGDLEQLFDETKPDVIIDFTVHPATVEIATHAVARGIRPVIGATGWSVPEREALAHAIDSRGIGGLLVPNFALGAILMMRFAEQAAPFFPSVEIIELHHDGKKDAPSGTARLTAERIAAKRLEKANNSEKKTTLLPKEGDFCDDRPARGERVPEGGSGVSIHSVRLRGLIAHQEVIFGGEGETLTIRHDSLSRESFAAGILAAVRAVPQLRGLTVGLDSILFP